MHERTLCIGAMPIAFTENPSAFSHFDPSKIAVFDDRSACTAND